MGTFIEALTNALRTTPAARQLVAQSREQVDRKRAAIAAKLSRARADGEERIRPFLEAENAAKKASEGAWAALGKARLEFLQATQARLGVAWANDTACQRLEAELLALEVPELLRFFAYLTAVERGIQLLHEQWSDRLRPSRLRTLEVVWEARARAEDLRRSARSSAEIVGDLQTLRASIEEACRTLDKSLGREVEEAARFEVEAP